MELKIPKRQNQNNVLPNTQIKYTQIMRSLRPRFIGERIHRGRERERKRPNAISTTTCVDSTPKIATKPKYPPNAHLNQRRISQTKLPYRGVGIGDEKLI